MSFFGGTGCFLNRLRVLRVAGVHKVAQFNSIQLTYIRPLIKYHTYIYNCRFNKDGPCQLGCKLVKK